MSSGSGVPGAGLLRGLEWGLEWRLDVALGGINEEFLKRGGSEVEAEHSGSGSRN